MGFVQRRYSAGVVMRVLYISICCLEAPESQMSTPSQRLPVLGNRKCSDTTNLLKQSDARGIREFFPVPDRQWPDVRGFRQEMHVRVSLPSTVRVADLNDDWGIIPSAPLGLLKIQRGENSEVTFEATAEGEYPVEFYADQKHKMTIVINAYSE
jgi:hypothetical protein